MKHWTKGWPAHCALRSAGTALLMADAMAWPMLVRLVANPVATHSVVAVVLAASLFVGFSVGWALVLFGPLLFVRVKLSRQWSDVNLVEAMQTGFPSQPSPPR